MSILYVSEQVWIYYSVADTSTEFGRTQAVMQLASVVYMHKQTGLTLQKLLSTRLEITTYISDAHFSTFSTSQVWHIMPADCISTSHHVHALELPLSQCIAQANVILAGERQIMHHTGTF